MTYLKKNKLLIFFFVIGIVQILYYWSERSKFKLEILKNPFKKNSHINFVLPERIIETNKILISNKIKKFNLSKNLKNDMYTYQRIIEFNYPIRINESSKFVFFHNTEDIPNTCKIIETGKYLKLTQC